MFCDAFAIVERLLTTGRVYLCNTRRAAAVLELCAEGEVAVLARPNRAVGGWWITLEE
jgi:hypothetical protein